jgi:hypothetical protein
MGDIFHFHIVIYTFITPERCEYLNTICEVIVYNFRACFGLSGMIIYCNYFYISVK